MARWVFYLWVIQFPSGFSRSPLTLQSAPVAKWLTRRSAKPVFAGSIPARRSKFYQRPNSSEIQMPNPTATSREASLLDVYAVALALALALLVRFNLLPAIKW
jgi:hypothetical protein